MILKVLNESSVIALYVIQFAHAVIHADNPRTIQIVIVQICINSSCHNFYENFGSNKTLSNITPTMPKEL